MLTAPIIVGGVMPMPTAMSDVAGMLILLKFFSAFYLTRLQLRIVAA
jgi:hypothetical protein